jgi:hypothetical protein
MFLMGASYVKGANRSYRIVAKDVLGYMESQGRLKQDKMGWYHLA